MKDKKFRRSKNVDDRRDVSRMDEAHSMFTPAPEGPGFSAANSAATSRMAQQLGADSLAPVATGVVASAQRALGGRAQDVQAAIVAAAKEVGMDPATALAIAERESSFKPNARSSKTIRGLFQMRGDHRARYGIGDSDDVATQVRGWVPFFRQVQKEMAGPLGRAPSDTEGYLGHHFGGARAGKMMNMDPATPVSQVFTPTEMAANPHFAKAGTVGQLNSSIIADIDRRRAKFGGQEPSYEPVDFSSLGDAVDTFDPPSSEGGKINMGSAQPNLPDFSNFGTPVS